MSEKKLFDKYGDYTLESTTLSTRAYTMISFLIKEYLNQGYNLREITSIISGIPAMVECDIVNKTRRL